MNTYTFKRIKSGLTPLTVAIAMLCGAPSAFAVAPAVGVVCTTAGANPTFNLDTKTGYISLPDGNTMFMWGYSVTGQPFQSPGPVLCVNEGDTVTVVLHNTLGEASSIMFPGQENVLAGPIAGPLTPAQPVGTGAALTSLTNSAATNGTVTYQFTASKPGTFIYESGTNPEKQVHMGLFGALIVRPLAGADHVNNRADSQFTTNGNSPSGTAWSEEFLALLSEIDPYEHQAAEGGMEFDLTYYHPHYWMLNGRGFPDSIADNNAPWLPSQPYGAMARVHPYDGVGGLHPYPGVERYLNVGTMDFPFHPHGNNGLVIGRDGKALEGPTGQDLAFEKFLMNVGPGQTWDISFKWYDAENYSLSNPVPVAQTDVANLSYLLFYGGSPYLGKQGPLPPGITSLNQCGEFYIISHNHSLFQINAWGLTMSGPITYMRVDPPLGPNNNCT